MATPKLTAEERSARFWTHVEVRGPDDCWLWTGAGRNIAFGYGRFRYYGEDGRPHLGQAHRFAWVEINGPVPAGALLLHRCDVPPCVNPAHLFLGTQADNMRDRRSKDHYAIGEKHPMAKLTDAAVRSIRCDRRKLREIAEEHGVTVQSVWLIRNRRQWKHLI